MECVSYTIEAEVPPEFTTVTTCSSAFFRVAGILDQLEGKEAVRKLTLLTTSRGHLVEVEEGKVQRSTPAPKDVTKIVVHHDFDLLLVYVVLLCRSEKAVLLAYHDLKVLQEWEGVQGITSADPMATGSPQLILTKMNDKMLISNAKLVSYTHNGSREREEEEEENVAGKKEAIQSMMHRFKGGIKFADQLRTERKTKENVIMEELAAFQCQLQGLHDDREKGMSVEGKAQQESVPAPPCNTLRVQRVYHRLVHDKWVVGVNVINEGHQVLVSGLELMLCCGEVPLHHSSCVLKTVRHCRPQGDAEGRISIDYLDPPVLRPGKRAAVVGVCEMPSFESGPSVSCSGLLSYTCKPLKAASSQTTKPSEMQYQVSVPMVELRASKLHNHMASLDLCNFSKACVSFGAVALVAASRCTQVSLSSLVSPLNTFLTKISHHLKLVKLSGLSDFYVLHPGDPHPLQNAAFTLHHADSHTLSLTLYTRDEKQALVLIHTLLDALPEDTTIQVLPGTNDTSGPANTPLDLHHTLLARMKEATTCVMDGLETQLSTNKAPRIEKKERSEEEDGFAKYTKEREELLVGKGDVTFKAKEYKVWRKKLQDVQTEVDSLYLKFLKLNCASD